MREQLGLRREEGGTAISTYEDVFGRLYEVGIKYPGMVGAVINRSSGFFFILVLFHRVSTLIFQVFGDGHATAVCQKFLPFCNTATYPPLPPQIPP